jgi:hypothetical protein
MSPTIIPQPWRPDVHNEIDELLLSGKARTMWEAESQFLDAHLPQLAHLAVELTEAELREHEAVKLLLAHGSRRWEDAVP